VTEQCESLLRYDIVDVRQTGGGSNARVLYMVVSLHPENLPLAACVEELQSIRESSASNVHVSDTNVLQAECMRRIDQGCSPKKEVGGRLKQELDKDF